MNSIMIIHPYWKHETWCFTDDSVGLKDEPFVAGADKMISMALVQKGILMEAEKGFDLLFSAVEFPGHDIVLEHMEDNLEFSSGNWYKTIINQIGVTGWLCPALFKYFEEAPEKIYAKFVINENN